MADDRCSVTQTQIEPTMAGMIVPSIQADDLKLLLGEKVKGGSVSFELENSVKMSSHASENSRITVSDGSDIQETVKEDMGFINEAERRNGFHSDVKDNQEMVIKPEDEVLQVVSVYPQDSTVILVVEKEEGLMKYPSSSEVKEMGLGKKRYGGCSEDMKQEVIRKKEKCSKRNGKGIKRFSEMDGRQNLLGFYAEARNVCGKKDDGSKIKYSRSEMEAMRFVNGDEQRKIWREIYVGLGPVVSRELNGMAEFKNQKFSRRSTDHYQHGGSRNVQGPILSEDSFSNVEHNLEEKNSGNVCLHKNLREMNSLNLASVDADNRTVAEEECNEDDDSDDDYDSIQKPAFFVEGDPDFDSGPPQDGLEYLRRVRWETAQIPKVKVAKLQKTKVSEQTVYMPIIPDIEQCPEHLQPTKQWEDVFLTDFLELRRVLSLQESSSFQSCNNPQLVLPVADDDSSNPTVSLILGMDSVSRASMLRKCISLFETKSTLSRHECIWLFALCAAVDVPLDADMSATLRCLLRKSANLRAGKSEFDDEVMMLNMLVAISGRFFRQLE